MKIKIITCHDVYNLGASLQSYALQTYLDKFGHEVEIIDYKPKYLSQHYKLLTINSEKWKKNILTKAIYIVLKFPGRIISLKRKVVFDKFTKKYLKLTDKRYKDNDQLKNAIPLADVYICGSDQIWNCMFENGNDPAFYLDFVPDNKLKISYAASFSMDSIPNELKIILKKRIERLEYISVREIDAIKLLQEMNIKNAVHVLDPVFLLKKSHWDDMVNLNIDQRYVLIYSFDNKEKISEIATKISKEKKCKIYSMSRIKCAHKNFQYASPNEFLGLIKNAEHIVTNSFHAVAFSMIFNKNFTVVGREENINTRMTSLLKSANLENKYVTKEFNINNALESINYEIVNIKLKDMIDKSKMFLDLALKNS